MALYLVFTHPDLRLYIKLTYTSCALHIFKVSCDYLNVAKQSFDFSRYMSSVSSPWLQAWEEKGLWRLGFFLALDNAHSARAWWKSVPRSCSGQEWRKGGGQSEDKVKHPSSGWPQRYPWVQVCRPPHHGSSESKAKVGFLLEVLPSPHFGASWFYPSS